MTFNIPNALAGLVIGGLIGAFVGVFLPVMYSFEPDAFNTTKEYYDCKEPGLFSTGRIEGSQCYTTNTQLNEPYKSRTEKAQLALIGICAIGMALNLGFSKTAQEETK